MDIISQKAKKSNTSRLQNLKFVKKYIKIFGFFAAAKSGIMV